MAVTDSLRDRIQLPTLVVSALVGLVAVAGSYLVAGSSAGFVAVPIHGLVVRYMPAAVLTFSILVLGQFGEQVGFALAIVLTVAIFGVASAIVWVTIDRIDLRIVGTAAVTWLVAVVLVGDPPGALGTALPAALVVAIADGFPGQSSTAEQAVSRSRRRLLALAAGSIGFAGLSYVIGRRASAPEQPQALGDVGGGTSIHTTTGAGPGGGGAAGTTTMTPTGSAASAIDRRLAEAESKSLSVQGLHGLVSDVGSFYQVDVDSVDPSVDRGSWTLSVTGSVENETTLTFEDLTGYQPDHRFVTLRCVGEHLNAHLMDNALWTGVPVAKVLDEAGASGSFVTLHAADGYFESYPIAALRPGLLAYGMNGNYLPKAHGAPVRALVPGHWGETNVKWLTKIEVTEKERPSYWEQRGWHGTGPVNTVAKLWAVNHLDGSTVQVGGYAYAGTRGIDRVQVSTDGGSTWNEATLSDPLPDADVWRQWACTWSLPSGSADVVVRAIDGTGAVQPQRDRSPFPSGATGWVRKTVQGG